MGSHVAAGRTTTLEEVRVALIDIRSAYSQQHMEMQLLEEKIAKLKPIVPASSSGLESRLSQLERRLEIIEADLRQLSSHANQTTESLTQYKTGLQALEVQASHLSNRLDELSKLKSTLNSISQSLSNTSSSGKLHHVVSGETLEKIARRYNISVEELKTRNQLKSTTIFPGQELKVP